MQIRRDYSQPIFGTQRRRRGVGKRIIFFLGLLVGIAGLLAMTQRDRIESVALDIMGLAPTPTALPSNLATQAMQLYVSGNAAGAAQMFEQALEQRPENVDYLYEYGLILISMGDYERAVELGDQIILLDGFDPRGFALKARALVWMGDTAAALPVALAGTEVDRQFSPLYSVISRAYTSSGNIRAGIENAELAIEYDPMNADAYRSYAYALNNAAAYEEAIEQLEIAVSIDPSNIDVYMELAGYYLWNNRDQEAIDLYTTILTLQPRNARAMLRLCDAYRKIGQFDVALGHCEDAANADTSYAAAQLRYALLRYSERDFETARTYFERCLEADESSLDCQYRLGLTYYYLYLQSVDNAFNAADPTQRAQFEAQGVEYCDQAWSTLQSSLLAAQAQSDAGETLENIRLGLGFVARECPAYNGLAPLPVEPTPEFTPTPETAQDAAQDDAGGDFEAVPTEETMSEGA